MFCTLVATWAAACESTSTPPGTTQALEATWDRTLPAPGLTGRWAAPLIPLNRALFTFGGSTVADGSPSSASYAFQLDDSSWHIRDDRGRPSARAHHCGAPIPPLDQVLIVGGADANGPMPPRAWTLEATIQGWTSVDGTDEAPLPSGVAGCHAAWVPTRQIVVVFGGEAVDGLSDDTSVYDPRARSFRRLAIAPADRPPARRDGALVCDPASGRLLLFGGYGVRGELDDLWLFDGERWQLLAAHADPGPRRGAAAAFLDDVRRFVVVGGLGPDGALDDAWAWAPESSTWERLAPAPDPSRGRPAPRAFAAAAWERDGKRLLLFGGLDGAMGVGAPLSDGWALHLQAAGAAR
jgi:hypothetical protein